MNRKYAHICFVAPKIFPILSGSRDIMFAGGAEVQQTFIAQALSRLGYKVSIVCLDYGQEERLDMDGISVYKAHRPDGGVPIFRYIHPRATSFWRAMKKVNADVYYNRCASMHTGLVSIFCKTYNKKFIYAASSNTDFQPTKLRIRYRRDILLYEWGLRHADIVIVQNEEQRRLCMQNYGLQPIFIKSGYIPQDGQNGERNYDVLWVSTIRPIKRPELFIEIAKRLPEYKFKMIGGPYGGSDDNTYYKRIEGEAKRACIGAEH